MSFNKLLLSATSDETPTALHASGHCRLQLFGGDSEKRKDKSGDMQEITTWFRVTMWGKQAETASKYLTKVNRFISKDACESKNGRIATEIIASHWKSMRRICSLSAPEVAMTIMLAIRRGQ
jgi:single-stranded DNA-binding protein